MGTNRAHPIFPTCGEVLGLLGPHFSHAAVKRPVGGARLAHLGPGARMDSSGCPAAQSEASEASPTAVLHSTLRMCAVSCSVLVFHSIAHEFSKQLVGVSLGSFEIEIGRKSFRGNFCKSMPFLPNRGKSLHKKIWQLQKEILLKSTGLLRNYSDFKNNCTDFQ